MVTSLPYLDEKIDDTSKSIVSDLIKAEMATMPKKDYLEKLPQPALKFLESDFIRQELERVSKHTELNALNNKAKYLQVEEPLEKSNLSLW